MSYKTDSAEAVEISYIQMVPSNDEEKDQSGHAISPRVLTVWPQGKVVRRHQSFKAKKLKKHENSLETLLQNVDSDEETDDKYSKPGEDKMDMVHLKSNLEKFFRNAGTVHGSFKDSDTSQTANFIQKIIEQEFPQSSGQFPSRRELIHVGPIKKNKSTYKPGDWVEIEGDDMKWRLDKVTRVIKIAPDDWDWNAPENEDKEPTWEYFYHAGSRRHIKEEDLRSPEAGLKTIFGCRPWVWQQWAIIKVEEILRFQLGHQDDFFEKDIQKLAADLWEQWLNHPANVEFYELFYDERIGDKGRSELLNHIQKPFELIDMMAEDNDEWNFGDDDNVNVFTYLSLLGSGISLPFVILAIQITIPILLVIETMKQNTCENFKDLPDNVFLAKVTAVPILFYYLYSVVPDTYDNFYNILGSARTVYSRIISLRSQIWFQGDDTLIQMLGFKLDVYMNTSYQTILLILNIYVILMTEDAIDVVLNALAFIFIARIDEETAQANWYDNDKRWVTAGAVEVAMLSTIRLRVLGSSKLFSEHFDIHEELLLKVCDEDKNLLNNLGLAKIDANDFNFMTDEERINMMCAKVSKDSKNEHAMEEYIKKPAYFGYIERLLNKFYSSSATVSFPAFERFTPYRTWSRWEKLLYLSPVPFLEDIFVEDDNGKFRFTEELDLNKKYSNYYPEESNKTGGRAFMDHFWRALLFGDLLPSLKPVWQAGHYLSFLFRLFDGIFLNWGTYFIHIIFPLYLLTSVVEVIYNITSRKCFNPFVFISDEVRGWFVEEGNYYN